MFLRYQTPLLLFRYIAQIRNKHSNPDFLTESVINTLQTFVDIANEYLQAYNTTAEGKYHRFLVWININVQVTQLFL